jgi:hypothetical protein
LVVADPYILCIWLFTFEKVYGDMFDYLLRYFVAERAKLVIKVVILMLDVRYGAGEVILVIEESIK